MASGKSNCRSKYCPALIAMLRTVGRMRNKDICALLNMKPSAVYNIINRHGLADSKYLRKSMISDIEREYLAGYSSYELAEKYGVNSGTIRKWMHDLGHVKGKDQSTEFAKQCELAINTKRKNAAKASSEARRKKAIEKLEEKLLSDGGEVSLVEYSNYRSTYKCNTCGFVFSRAREIHGYKICCPECKKHEAEKNERQKAEKQKQLEAERLEEYEKDKICQSCGCVFHSEHKTKIYCSATCSRREKRRRNAAAGKTKLCDYGNHRKRARVYGVAYEPGITIKKLVKRDGNICQICGEPCDANDLRWGYSGPLYPSIDHIVAMANGGGHTWDNVQLAHLICNSNKRDLLEEELTEEVITHAKEQAIAYKCA